MPLTAGEHQKVAALQQIANLVSQAASVAGNPNVLNNVINNTLPLITQWERSDPEMGQLARLLRRARVDKSPHIFSNILGQVQRMINIVRTGLPYRLDPQYGLKTQYDFIRGHVTSPLFEKGEPVRTYSHMGWRGSKKFPFGLPFPQKNVIEGWDRPSIGYGAYGEEGTAAAVATGGASKIASGMAKILDQTESMLNKEPIKKEPTKPQTPEQQKEKDAALLAKQEKLRKETLATQAKTRKLREVAAKKKLGIQKQIAAQQKAAAEQKAKLEEEKRAQQRKKVILLGIFGFIALFGGAVYIALQE